MNHGYSLTLHHVVSWFNKQIPVQRRGLYNLLYIRIRMVEAAKRDTSKPEAWQQVVGGIAASATDDDLISAFEAHGWRFDKTNQILRYSGGAP